MWLVRLNRRQEEMLGCGKKADAARVLLSGDIWSLLVLVWQMCISLSRLILT